MGDRGRLTRIGNLSRTFNANVARAVPSGLCLAGLTACTWLSFRFGQGFAFTGFLYLILVVLEALYGGFWQATVISVTAAACLNYFFAPPIFSFVNSPENWVALGAFEFTALVISRLSQRANLRAAEAIAGRRDVERLYETSRRSCSTLDRGPCMRVVKQPMPGGRPRTLTCEMPMFTTPGRGRGTVPFASE